MIESFMSSWQNKVIEQYQKNASTEITKKMWENAKPFESFVEMLDAVLPNAVFIGNKHIYFCLF